MVCRARVLFTGTEIACSLWVGVGILGNGGLVGPGIYHCLLFILRLGGGQTGPSLLFKLQQLLGKYF